MFDPTVNPFTGQPIFSAYTPVIPVEPTIPTGEEVYDQIMGNIEPELTTSMMPTLDEKYANETADEHTARQERYKNALAEYQKQLTEYMTGMHTQMSQFERGLRESAELAEQMAESKQLDSITSQINNS